MAVRVEPVVSQPQWDKKTPINPVTLKDGTDVGGGTWQRNMKEILEYRHPEYVKYESTWQRCLDCYEGEIEKMRALCATAGATLVEDAAASIGSRVNGRLTGTFGDLAFYSFDSTKLINVPMKGGFVTARDADLFARIKGIYLAEIIPMPALHKLGLLAKAAILTIIENHFLYRLFHWLTFGLTGRFTAESADLDLEKGEFYIYDLANWQAGIAAPQVAGIDKIIAVRQETYARYRSELRDCTAFDLPPCDTASEWACIRFPIRIRGDKYSFYRSAVRRGIDFAFSFTYIACPRDFRNATRLAESVLDLPFYSKLSNKEFQRVVRALKSLDATAGRCIRGT